MSLKSRFGGFLKLSDADVWGFGHRDGVVYSVSVFWSIWSLAVFVIPSQRTDWPQEICWKKCSANQFVNIQASALCFFSLLRFFLASICLYFLSLYLPQFFCLWSYSIRLALHFSPPPCVVKSSSQSSKKYPRWLPIGLRNHPSTPEPTSRPNSAHG